MAERPGIDASSLLQIEQRDAERVTRTDVPAELRAARRGHEGAIVWLTGLSGAGKSTIATRAQYRLFADGYDTYLLDGDSLRRGISADLGFTAADRRESVRRAAHIAALFADAGLVVIVAMISPFAADRALARRIGGAAFHEVYVEASLATCERRDPRGLYRMARAGEIAQFTGISSPYEPPATPDLVVRTDDQEIDASVERLLAYVTDKVPRRR